MNFLHAESQHILLDLEIKASAVLKNDSELWATWRIRKQSEFTLLDHAVFSHRKEPCESIEAFLVFWLVGAVVVYSNVKLYVQLLTLL